MRFPASHGDLSMRILQTVGDLFVQADALRLDIVPVFRVVLDDGGPRVGELALDTVQGFETAVLEANRFRLVRAK